MAAYNTFGKCPICGKKFYARSDQAKKAKEEGREFPACSHECERERRYGASRDKKWLAEWGKKVKGLTSPN